VRARPGSTASGRTTSTAAPNSRQLDGLDKPVGEQRNICVRTGEDNLAIIDPDAPTTAGGPGFDLHYSIRYERG
jgi:hypothetical protein